MYQKEPDHFPKENELGHFRVVFRLCVKKSLRANRSYENEVDFHANQTSSFSYEGTRFETEAQCYSKMAYLVSEHQ